MKLKKYIQYLPKVSIDKFIFRGNYKEQTHKHTLAYINLVFQLTDDISEMAPGKVLIVDRHGGKHTDLELIQMSYNVIRCRHDFRSVCLNCYIHASPCKCC